MLRPNLVTKPIKLGPIIPLVREDLKLLLAKRPEKPVINAIRERHHALARAIASGHPLIVCAKMCNYSYSRVVVLQQDPTFKELVEYYKELVKAGWKEEIDQREALALEVSMITLQHAKDKLLAADESGEFLPTREITALLELTLDRTGMGKQQMNVNVNMDFAGRLEQANRRTAQVLQLVSSQSAPAVGAGEVNQPALKPPQLELAANGPTPVVPQVGPTVTSQPPSAPLIRRRA